MKSLRTTLWAATIGYWVVLLVITHIPQARVPRTPMSDKTAHLLAYFVLGALLSLAVWMTSPRRRFTWAVVLVILIAYGSADEFTQAWVGRYPEVGDWLADSVGAAIGVGVVGVVRLAVE